MGGWIVKQKKLDVPSSLLHSNTLTSSPSLVSQSGSQAKLLHGRKESVMTVLLLEQLSLCTYSFKVTYMMHFTSRVCLPLPHDLEQSDQGVVYQLLLNTGSLDNAISEF